MLALDRPLRLDVYILEAGGALASLATDVRAGLSRTPKELLPKYFYDAVGSELFEEITRLPEYYQTRTELGILQRVAPGLVAELRPHEILEIGSGSASKTRTLLDALDALGGPCRFLPFDVSESMLRQSAQELFARYPRLAIHGIVGDFEHHLAGVPPGEHRLAIFLGGTIGNLWPAERVAFLRAVRGLLGPDSHFLLGVDLVKDVAMLDAAYNDSAGVTAEFNKNVLRVLNRELAANFNLDQFEHHAFYNRQLAQIEMWLRSTTAQQVHIAALDMTVAFAAGEEMRTEISGKFTRASVEALFAESGLVLERWETDPNNLFALALGAPHPPARG